MDPASIVLFLIPAVFFADGPPAASSLPVPPRATDVVVSEAGQGATVECDVKESFPARETIAYLVEALRDRGFALVDTGGFEDKSLSLSRLFKLAERGMVWPPLGEHPLAAAARTARESHVFEGRWRNESGDEVSYKLTYECPLEQQGLHSVHVHLAAARYGAKEAERRATERRERREALCRALRARPDSRPTAAYCAGP